MIERTTDNGCPRLLHNIAQVLTHDMGCKEEDDSAYFNPIMGNKIDWSRVPEPSTATTYTCKECGKVCPIHRADPNSLMGDLLNMVKMDTCPECIEKRIRELEPLFEEEDKLWMKRLNGELTEEEWRKQQQELNKRIAERGGA